MNFTGKKANTYRSLVVTFRPRSHIQRTPFLRPNRLSCVGKRIPSGSRAPMLTIRRARRADLPLLDTLEKEFDRDLRLIVLKQTPRLKMYLRRTPELNRIIAKRFRKRVRSKKAIVLIAEVDSTAVGFSTISIETNRGLLPRRFGHIGYLFVSRQYRGQRISSRMLKELLSWLGKRRIRHVGLSVLADHRHARAIYKRWEFREHGLFMWKLH